LPKYFEEKIQEQILESINGLPLISISQKPINFGENICVGDIGQSHLNIYRQLLIGAKIAKTDYIAACEDDTIYTPSHFTSFLPDLKTFAYNINRWRVYTWRSLFSYTERIVLSQMIAPRQLFVNALQERFNKYPDENKIVHKYFCEPGRRERLLKVTPQKKVLFKSNGPPNLVFTHADCLGYAHQGKKKALGNVTAKTLEHWGTVQDVKRKYYRK
jgi:hypothetical protein